MYQTTTIYDMINKANRNVICLPSIQRQFVWQPAQIEKLFDSIFHGYPIGTFLIWKVSGESISNYKFYYLLRNFHERDMTFNDQCPLPNPTDEIEAFLDGQQRMTALYIALQGSYTSKKPGARAAYINSFIERKLYFNLLGYKKLGDENFEDDEIRLFKMLSQEELIRNNNDLNSNHVWHPVSDFIDNKWNAHQAGTLGFQGLVTDILNLYIRNSNISEIMRNNSLELTTIVYHIQCMVEKIRKGQIISFYSIQDRSNLNDVAEIFIRVNDGGTKLSKSDLLFSTVVSRWEVGRDKIHQLIKDIKLLGYEIDTDFVMRTCLYLTNSEILFKVENFQVETVNKIISQFNVDGEQLDIRGAIIKTFELIQDKLGISEKTLKSKNVLIPIVYHIYNGGRVDKADSIEEIKKFLYISLLQKVFGSHGDTLLKQLRDGILNNNSEYKLANISFNYKTLINGIKDKQKRELYYLDKEDIYDFLSVKKSDESWLVLSLTYPPLNHNMFTYDQDHLHPLSRFKRTNFQNKTEDYFNKCDGLKDTVPNLAFLKPEDNRDIKRNSYLITYIEKNITNIVLYKQFNFIDETISLDISDYYEFYQKRKQRMFEILCLKFGVEMFENLANNSDDNIQEDSIIQPDPPITPVITENSDEAKSDVKSDLDLLAFNNADDGHGSDIRGVIVNNNELINLPKINTTACFKVFINYCIDKFGNDILGYPFSATLIRIDPNDPAFGRAIHYKRVREYKKLYYSDYTSSAIKKQQMLKIANELGLNIDFIY